MIGTLRTAARRFPHRRRAKPARLALRVLVAVAAAARAGAAVERPLASAPFRVVSRFPAGGPVDTLARLLATGPQDKYKQAAVVDHLVSGGAFGKAIGQQTATRAQVIKSRRIRSE